MATVAEFLTPGTDSSIATAASSAPGDAAQQAYAVEYSALGIKTNLAIPLTTTTPSNNVGVNDPVGGTGPQSTVGPVSSNNNMFQGMNGFLSGIGWWIGTDGGTPKLSIGDPNGDNMYWDGNQLVINGTFNIGGSTITINDTKDIQTYVNIIHNDGGGTLYLLPGTWHLTSDITLYDGVNIIGSGYSGAETTLDFGGTAHGFIVKGTNGNNIDTIKLSNFAIFNSNATAVIDLDYAVAIELTDLTVDTFSGIGVRVKRSYNIRLDTLFLLLGASGIEFDAIAHTGNNGAWFANNVFSAGNTGDGFLISMDPAATNIYPSSFSNCNSQSNGGIGYNILDGSISFPGVMFNCFAVSNTGDGFYVGNQLTSFTNCSSRSNTGYGFNIQGAANTFLGNYSYLNTAGQYNVISGNNGNVILGSYMQHLQSSPAGRFEDSDTSSFVFGTGAASSRIERKIYWMKNTSGGAVAQGNVVILQSAASGEEITTTTSQGDSHVFGVVQDSSVANNAYGNIIAVGFTSHLKVNGTVDIAIGDFLGTYTSAGIAMKASAGDMCFAMALEAYTGNDSNGIIDALIFTPRKL